jgi:hypothetical protein
MLMAKKTKKEEKVRFNMIVAAEELAMYKAAAEAARTTMSAWARLILFKAAGK